MKTITFPVLLQFDAIGRAPAAEQAATVRDLVNEALAAAGINSEPALLPAPVTPDEWATLRTAAENARAFLADVLDMQPAAAVDALSNNGEDVEEKLIAALMATPTASSPAPSPAPSPTVIDLLGRALVYVESWTRRNGKRARRARTLKTSPTPSATRCTLPHWPRVRA